MTRAGGSTRRRLRALRTAPDDAGQIMLLTLVYAGITLALVLVLASASAVHIERKQLLTLADAAALDAADAFDPAAFYGDGSPVDSVPLSNATVRQAVEHHLSVAPNARNLSRLAVGEPTGSPDGRTAQVTLHAVAQPPFIPWALVAWWEGVPLRVTASAQAVWPAP